MNLPIPPVLYHYCDLNAFLSILNHKKIWLSNSYLMNDSFENTWINSHIDEISKEFVVHTELLKWVVESYIGNPEVPYISCFSSNGDILSQWRAYSNDGKGVSIGFNTAFFQSVGIFDHPSHTGYPIILSPVIYDIDAQKKLIRDVFIKIIQLIQEEGETNASQYGHTALKRLSIICKNPAFKEEAEYRLIYLPYYPALIHNVSQIINLNVNNLPIKFRSKDDQVVSYFEYDISSENSDEPINSIILGPKNKISNHELRAILNSFSIKTSKLFKSNASYR